MECQPQNPEFRNNAENVHPCLSTTLTFTSVGSHGWKQETEELIRESVFKNFYFKLDLMINMIIGHIL